MKIVMDVMINYGDEQLTLKLPDNITFDEFRHGSGSTTVDITAFMQSLTSAEEIFFNIDDADLYIVNDAYRPTPTRIILKWLESSGKLSKKAKFLVSTGCHHAPAHDQMYDIFGEMYDSLKDRIFVHNARDKNSMVSIGNDNRLNGDILLNRFYVEAKKVVVIGSVEPHYFAGFTGGRKSIFPGLCDFDTVVRNHRLATSREAMPLRLDGNPIEEHFRYMMQMVPTDKIFSIQIVQGKKGEMAGIFCGEINESFNRAKEQSKKLFGIETESKYDLLLAEVRPPLDSSLYQLQKSLENCQSAVGDNGKIMLFSPCREGIGEDGFYKLADRWDPESKNQPTDNFGIHKLRRVYDIGRRIDIDLFSELPDGIPDKVFFSGIKKPQAIIDNFVEDKMSVCLVHDAGHTVMITKN
jgi:lactate racemase